MKPLLMLTTVALLGTTSLVAAQETTAVNAFSLQERQSADGVLELGLVTAEADGVIEIYEIDDTAMTTPMGSQPVTAGANADVKITLTQQPLSDVIAVLKIGGVVVAQQEIDLDDDAGDGDDSGGGEGDEDVGDGDDPGQLPDNEDDPGEGGDDEGEDDAGDGDADGGDAGGGDAGGGEGGGEGGEGEGG